MFTARRIVVVVVTTLGMIATTACNPFERTDKGPPAAWPVSFQWETDPGVDLESPAARVVRATFESTRIETFLGREYTYPGYQEVPRGPYGGQLRPVDDRELSGTLRAKYVVVSSTPARTEAVVCADSSGLSHTASGQPVSRDMRYAPDLVWSTRIVVLRSDAPAARAIRTSVGPVIEPRVPTTAELSGPPGRSARPTSNMFDGWILRHLALNDSSAGQHYCMPWAVARWRDDTPRISRGTGDPAPIEPFSPGWDS